VQAFLRPPDLTILLDIAPETAVGRKSSDRDSYERNLTLLSGVRASYLRQAEAGGWTVVDGERPKDEVAADVASAVDRRLAPA
jgi:thymidylate kinase